MTKKDAIKVFEDKKIRAVWDDQKEEWYFSIVDVIEVLTDSERPRKYWGDLKKKLKTEGSQLSEEIGQLKLPSSDGKLYKTDVATTQQLFRLIQSIPSPKAEPFKMWMAQVAKEHLDEMQDPELTINRAMMEYKSLGYSDNWINQRLKSIEVRKELTDEWKRNGMQEGVQFAALTDIIYQTWAEKSAKEYKKLKGLKKENLRDNMSTMEIVLNMLAEATTTELSKAHQPEGFSESQKIAHRGGSYAGQVRQDIEKDTGRPVITSQNAAQLNAVVVDMIESVAETEKPDNDENK